MLFTSYELTVIPSASASCFITQKWIWAQNPAVLAPGLTPVLCSPLKRVSVACFQVNCERYPS